MILLSFSLYFFSGKLFTHAKSTVIILYIPYHFSDNDTKAGVIVCNANNFDHTCLKTRNFDQIQKVSLNSFRKGISIATTIFRLGGVSGCFAVFF